jgi:hypothetical protein
MINCWFRTASETQILVVLSAAPLGAESKDLVFPAARRTLIRVLLLPSNF